MEDTADGGDTPQRFNFAAYSPSRALRHLSAVDLTNKLETAFDKSLAFDTTLQNEATQAWLCGQYSAAAIARDKRQSDEPYERALRRFKDALDLIYSRGEVAFDVDYERGTLQPR